MSKKNGGGKLKKKIKKNDTAREEMIFKDDSQEYGQVTKMLGNSRVDCMCFDGKARQCHIRGTMKRKIWIGVGDIVLVSLRDYQDGKGDILLKYSPEESRILAQKGCISEKACVGGQEEEEISEVVFAENETINLEDL
jgi:translation initiation factor 1A